MLGIGTSDGPLDTMSFTAVPRGSGVPAGGSVPITLPLGTVSLGVWTAVTWKPAAPRVAAAANGSCVVTSGTGIAGSRATVTVTVGRAPSGNLATGAPAGGSVDRTVPGGWSLSASTKFAVRFALASDWAASARGLPDDVGHGDGRAAHRERDEPFLGELAARFRILLEHEVGRLGGLVDVLALPR